MRSETSNERQTEINRIAGKRTRFTRRAVQGSGFEVGRQNESHGLDEKKPSSADMFSLSLL